jgi:hypothetical protein
MLGVDGVPSLPADGNGPRAARRAMRLPTEGVFRLRAFENGDDVRRIHWVRSLAAQKLIVRLPDEIPPDQPKVRLVLDTYFPEALVLETHATSEMLDGMVQVWLAVAQAFAARGVRVSLVSVTASGEALSQAFVARVPGPSLALGAKVEWQGRVPVDALLASGRDTAPAYVVSRAVLVDPSALSGDASHRWILVRGTVSEPPWSVASPITTPHPLGHSENRAIARIARRAVAVRQDFVRAFRASIDVAPPPPGSLVATIGSGRVRLEVIP